MNLNVGVRNFYKFRGIEKIGVFSMNFQRILHEFEIFQGTLLHFMKFQGISGNLKDFIIFKRIFKDITYFEIIYGI